MFSFRTTPLEQQPDLVLKSGRVGVLCNQVAWNPEKGEYLFETLYKNGNLKKVFTPDDVTDAYKSLGLDGCEFFSFNGYDADSLSEQAEQLSDIDALVVELQDVGSRYYPVLSILLIFFSLFIIMILTCLFIFSTGKILPAGLLKGRLLTLNMFLLSVSKGFLTGTV